MTKSGLSLTAAGISLIVIGTVISPALHQPALAIQTDDTAWQVVDGLITASGAILLLAGLVLGALGVRATRRQKLPLPSAGSDRNARRASASGSAAISSRPLDPFGGYQLLASAISIFGLTALTLTLVTMAYFSQI